MVVWRALVWVGVCAPASHTLTCAGGGLYTRVLTTSQAPHPTNRLSQLNQWNTGRERETYHTSLAGFAISPDYSKLCVGVLLRL